ncbi:hypothetical protein B0I35DRAFT_18104 [Stachybotrys elegans]|uniref:Uncharacterized protein n=1 Tax=Stachybotrys elegans TaxID=80388 RepID=A0A8K0T797_9HYPO|nr:hypothetical protein B0I35DRAFT_18104 [Stachybotrys elegans]
MSLGWFCYPRPKICSMRKFRIRVHRPLSCRCADMWMTSRGQMSCCQLDAATKIHRQTKKVFLIYSNAPSIELQPHSQLAVKEESNTNYIQYKHCKLHLVPGEGGNVHNIGATSNLLPASPHPSTPSTLYYPGINCREEMLRTIGNCATEDKKNDGTGSASRCSDRGFCLQNAPLSIEERGEGSRVDQQYRHSHDASSPGRRGLRALWLTTSSEKLRAL